jgi:transposase InsO family protein
MKNDRDIVKLRRWCIRKRGEGEPVSEICTATQIPRRTFYNWWNRYRQDGLDALNPQSKRPRTIHRTSAEMRDEIKKVRMKTGWCPHKIAGYLRVQGRPVGHMTVYRTLLASGLNHPLTKPRIKRTYRRWQRIHSNSLWQCDLKLVDARWLITILDDHSRFVTGSEIFNEGTAENVIDLFDQAVNEYDKPREILTDHGSQFWSVRRGESSFDAYCEQHGIKHILGGIGKPTTQGKIERWFRTYDLEHERYPVHRKFIEYYNYKRPHMALDYSTPAEVYFGDVPHVLG